MTFLERERDKVRERFLILSSYFTQQQIFNILHPKKNNKNLKIEGFGQLDRARKNLSGPIL